MAPELVDRLVARIAREVRMARAATHNRARVAHHMIADAYRARLKRLLQDKETHGEGIARPSLRATSLRKATDPGFLTDRTA